MCRRNHNRLNFLYGVTIDTQNLLMQDNALLSTVTVGNGDGGNLTITATDVQLLGASNNGVTLNASVGEEGIGNGGDLTSVLLSI